MNAFEFYDIEFQKLSVKLGNEYKIHLDGRAKAIHAIINGMRTFYKYSSIPLLFGEYILMKIGITKPPESPLKKEKAELEAKAKAEKEAKAVVMNVSRETTEPLPAA